MQELTSILSISSLSLVNSGTLLLLLYFHLPMTWTVSRERYQDTYPILLEHESGLSRDRHQSGLFCFIFVALGRLPFYIKKNYTQLISLTLCSFMQWPSNQVEIPCWRQNRKQDGRGTQPSYHPDLHPHPQRRHAHHPRTDGGGSYHTLQVSVQRLIQTETDVAADTKRGCGSLLSVHSPRQVLEGQSLSISYKTPQLRCD